MTIAISVAPDSDAGGLYISLLTEPTLWTSITMAAREPGLRVAIGMYSLYSGVPYS